MRTLRVSTIFLTTLFFVIKAFANDIDTKDSRMLSQPAISSDHIAFIYAEDLWVANPDGSQPRRLTVDEGIESNPFFSPRRKMDCFQRGV